MLIPMFMRLHKKSRTLSPAFSTKYKIRTYDPIRVKDVLYH